MSIQDLSCGWYVFTGLADYLNGEMDGIDVGSVFCHVKSPECVKILSSLQGDFLDRAEYIRATLDQIELPFNKWLDSEPFNIALQSCFVDMAGDDELAGVKDTDKATVLSYISNIRAMSEAATMDDGATQSVEVKTGIASKSVKVLPNPVTLRPYRTFTEVQQPASEFIFRARSENGKMQYTLVEADGGAWRSVAMKSIKAFMEKAVPGLKVIA